MTKHKLDRRMVIFKPKRLLRLAKHLRGVPREFLHMAGWKCGMTACALGHACDIPVFQRYGLHITFSYCNVGVPAFKEFYGFNAAEHFFGITHSEAMRLFAPDSEITPKQAALRIERFVTKKLKTVAINA